MLVTLPCTSSCCLLAPLSRSVLTESPHDISHNTTAEQPKSYAAITHAHTSQNQSEEDTTRPTTLMGNTPAIKTTPHAICIMHFNHQEEDDEEMYAEPHSIVQNTAAAARANLDYVKINGRLSDVLEDIDDIMLQQVSDVFQLSSWLSRVISIFGLKVCDEQEWHIFNRHYNCNTGEITILNTSETISPPNDMTMTEASMDELSRTHNEVALANTTIKNLSEVVVNFSHTGKCRCQVKSRLTLCLSMLQYRLSPKKPPHQH